MIGIIIACISLALIGLLVKMVQITPRLRLRKYLNEGGNDIVKSLIRAQSDKNWRVRMRASWALGKHGDTKAVEPLIVVMRDDNIVYVRSAAAKALCKIGEPKAIEPLRVALKVTENQKLSYGFFDALKAFKHHRLYCIKDHLRVRKIFVKNTYVGCRGCGNSNNLVKGIKAVVGLIGDDIKDYKQDGEKMYVNLWFESDKKARNADIDVLEIHESNGINYDYAVNAVLNVLKNDVSRPRKYVKNIPVVIRGNPPLSENSRMILKHEFGGIFKSWKYSE